MLLRSLTVRQGAGKFELGFSAFNPHPMELLKVSSGAASVELHNLTNANFSGMSLSRGAAGYELDFASTLLRYPAKDATPVLRRKAMPPEPLYLLLRALSARLFMPFSIPRSITKCGNSSSSV